LEEYLGYMAGAFTTFCLVPQVIRVVRLRSAKEISLIFAIALLIGVVSWSFYGVVSSLPPVIVWNAISSVIACCLLFAKLKYG